MLTIKVCSNEGHELVKEVESVMLRPSKETASGHDCVTYFPVSNPSNPEIAVDVLEGTVYVMNSNGKTVADYYLGSLPKAS
jgi:hypothetical protein